MTLLLDIDQVLIGWQHSKPIDSGFDDWTKREQRFFNWVSQEQLDLIASSFDDIRWHTTWIQRDRNGVPMTDDFTEATGFGPHPIAIAPVEKEATGGGGFTIAPGTHWGVSRVEFPWEIHEELFSTRWWKLNGVALMLAREELPGKVAWVDDELTGSTRKSVAAVLNHFDAWDRFLLIGPEEVFTRDDIVRASEWLRS